MARARTSERLFSHDCTAIGERPVVKVCRRTEADEAPGSAGPKRENTGSI